MIFNVYLIINYIISQVKRLFNTNSSGQKVSEKIEQCSYWFRLCSLLICKPLITLDFWYVFLTDDINITWRFKLHCFPYLLFFHFAKDSLFLRESIRLLLSMSIDNLWTVGNYFGVWEILINPSSPISSFWSNSALWLILPIQSIPFWVTALVDLLGDMWMTIFN